MDEIRIRGFKERDLPDIFRIWREVGWISGEDEEEALEIFLRGHTTLVAEVKGSVEGLAAWVPGELSYLEEEMGLQVITSVTISRVVRKRGLASSLTARLVQRGAEEGLTVSTLGMFEQGFYNKLGFGTGSYEHIISFDPASLKLKNKCRIPRRLSYEDWEEAHKCRVQRKKKHGYCTIYPPEVTRGEFHWKKKKGFGLGYFDGPGGELSHYLYGDAEDFSHGPYSINWLVYSNRRQLQELLALIKTMGDQVHLVRMKEPVGVQLQDLLAHPFKERRVTSNSKYPGGNRATAYWQMRLLDLKAVLRKTHLQGKAVSFNLELVDPIERYLVEQGTAGWQGLSGDYIITLGEESGAEPGREPSLPVLKASVGAFTRMWLGVSPASGLAVTDSLNGPAELLAELDRVLRLPLPRIDWDF